MLAENADRRVDLADHDGNAVAHIARINLNEVGTHVACGGETGTIVKDSAIARICGIPCRFAGVPRQRILAIVDWQITVSVDRHAEHHAGIDRNIVIVEQILLRELSLSDKPFEHSRDVVGDTGGS
jgi:hypothetical protein